MACPGYTAVALRHPFLVLLSWHSQSPGPESNLAGVVPENCTGLAFLVNMLLTAASRIAYMRRLWRTLVSEAISIGDDYVKIRRT
jgi:hypothetical protein